jgi:hypothetical protein
MALVLGNVYRKSLGHCAAIALALVPVMVSMQNRIDLRYADLPEELQDMTGTKVDQDRAVSVLDHVDVACIVQREEIRRKLREFSRRRKTGSGIGGALAARWFRRSNLWGQQTGSCRIQKIPPAHS